MHIRYRETITGVYRQSRNYAEYNVILFKKYRSTGAEMPNLWRPYLRDWQRLLKSYRLVIKRDNRFKFAWDLGRQIGRLKGSIKYRVSPV